MRITGSFLLRLPKEEQMNINDISTEKLVGMTLLQNTLKSQLGDGMEFELVYQALLNSMEGQEGNKDESSI